MVANWQFESCKVKSAASSQPTLPQTGSAAQYAALRQLKRSVEDFVRSPVVPSEDSASLLKTDKVDYIGEEITLPEALFWAQIAPALRPANLYQPLIWRKDQFGNCYVTQQKSFSLLQDGLSLFRRPKSGSLQITTWLTFAEVVPGEGYSRSSSLEMFSQASGRQCSMACSGCQRRGSWWRVPTFQF